MNAQQTIFARTWSAARWPSTLTWLVGFLCIAALLAWTLVLLKSTDQPLSVPTAVLGDGLAPDSAVVIGPTQVSTTSSTVSMHAADSPNGLIASWTSPADSLMELSISGTCSTENLTLRIDLDDGDNPKWHQLNFDIEPIVHFAFPLKKDSQLQAWLYSDLEVAATLSLLQLREFNTDVRQWILDWAGCLAEDSVQAKVSKVRQALHSCSVLTPGSPVLVTAKRHQFLVNFMQSKSVHGYCGNFGLAETLLLAEIGIPARPVQLATKQFVEGQDRFATHVLLEFFDPDIGKWVLSDPTFNIGFEDKDGNRLGLSEILADPDPEHPAWRTIQFYPTQANRQVDVYSIPIADFFSQVFTTSIDHFPAPHANAYQEALALIPLQLRSEISISASSTGIEDRAR